MTAPPRYSVLPLLLCCAALAALFAGSTFFTQRVQLAAPAGGLTIHLGIPAQQNKGSTRLLLMLANRSTAATEELFVTQVMPVGLDLLPEQSDTRCSVLPDDPRTVRCSLMAGGRSFSLAPNQSASFQITYRLSACASPVEMHTRALSAGTSATLAERTTQALLPCSASSPPPPATSTSVSSVPSLPKTSFSSSSLSSAHAAAPASKTYCIPFCTARDGNTSCKTVCSSFPVSPSLPSYLCPSGTNVQSFDCTIFPRTPKDGAYPRSTCEYSCT